jgi:pimeloyl-ACP methyl ester carboxylesterase
VSDLVTPFRIAVPDSALEDLRERLLRTRWPDRETVDDWSQGMPLEFLQRLSRYWLDTYDWRAREAYFNTFPQFRTEIDGLGFHFIHAPSPDPDAVPLVLTHGWPGSVLEFLKVIELLRDPASHGGDVADAFHVVCPSLPGYGFSDKPREPGWGIERIADAWSTVMCRLGYHRYGAQGGDWGGVIARVLARRHRAQLIGMHLNMVVSFPDPDTAADSSDEERDALAAMEHLNAHETGYYIQQATRPQTLGYGLADSPVAQCAWIVEKFWAWADCDGDPLNVFTRDEMLDNVMLYWLSETATSSARLYWESVASAMQLGPIDVPTGCSIFPKEIMRPSRRWAQRDLLDIRWWDYPARGGHFAAFEQPGIFVDQVRSFFRLVR